MSESNGNRGWFIDDGMSLRATVRGRKGLYPSFDFLYRPVLPERLYAYQRSLRTNPDREFATDIALLCEHVLAWSLPPHPYAFPSDADRGVQGDGMESVPTPDRIKRLHPTVIPQLINFITGHGHELVDLAGN